VPRTASFWPIVIASAAVIAITTGVRQSLGLFVRPLAATGLGIATVSFALAVGQFVWGAVQPAFGILADRIGAARVLMLGGILLAAGLGLAPLMPTGPGLLLTLGVVSAAGAGAGSFAILIGATAQRLPAERRALGSGLINSGGSFGQFLFAPLSQVVISVAGWAVGLWTLAAAGLATLAFARTAAGNEGRAPPLAAAASAEQPLAQALRGARADASYWCLHAGFFTCGFHIAFLTTHLPGEIALCGLPPQAAGAAIALIGLLNIVGSIGIGWLAAWYRMKLLLVALYAARAAAVGGYLLAPKTLTTLYLFSAVLGLTWLATVPLTAGLVGKLRGTRHLSTLFGFTFLSHQVGAFFGAWLGGIAMSMTGSYDWVWYADMGLAVFAALVNLPIREPRLRLRTA
jgi:MFS family permease